MSWRSTVAGLSLVVLLALPILMQGPIEPALAQGGAVPRAVDGRSLFDETLATQAMFIGTWGDAAATRWVTEHNAELARLQGQPVAAIPAVQPPVPTPLPTATPVPQRVTVEIRGLAFNPATITISRGSTIMWKNMDQVAHTATGPNFDSDLLQYSDAAGVAFGIPGRISYSCKIHPNMHGDIVVQ